ncbi:arylesterase [Erythrobacter sp. THAF29]|uniref:arylesterase n=1 Tax=Erythrobacter sp. THAF29 TaxID=2587851 RepID=UPI0012695FC3|nr:arylesterase [Erythrobacter sp. THAF29]QFT78432.1 Esterase TesA precursor [Erythrobacter sp. THAF29]
MQMSTWSKTKRFMAAIAVMPLALAACGESTENASAVPAEGTARAEGDLPAIPVMGPEVDILAFGDSLFAGYGVDKSDSYPAKLEAALRSRGINADIANAGVSGDTSAAGLQRLKFVLDAQDEVPELFILELGGNDLLRGIEPAETKANLAAMIEEVQSRGIPVLLMGMRAPPNYGPEYQAQFDRLYSELAEQYSVALIPFWLESIYRDPALFQSDRIHPTVEGIERLVGATVERVEAAIPEDARVNEPV